MVTFYLENVLWNYRHFVYVIDVKNIFMHPIESVSIDDYMLEFSFYIHCWVFKL